MIKLPKLNRLATALLIASSAAAVHAQGDTHKWEITALGGRNFFDDARNLDNGNSGTLGLGYVVNKHWTLEAMYEDFDSNVWRTNTDVDGRQLRLDALYNFANWNDWKPFILVGAGNQKFDINGFGSDDETFANVGLGIKRKISKSWLLRADTRAIYSFDEDLFDNSINFGVSYLFGGTGSTSQTHKTAPVTAPVNDSDGDGVLDNADQCRNTPVNASVDAQGCALDSDNDGVADYKDQCLQTPANYQVDETGCQLTKTKNISFNLSLHFAVNSADIQSYNRDEVTKIAKYMANHASAKVEIEGHTDSSGAAAYNKKLSDKRAAAVRDMLVKQYGLDAKRLSSKGYGEERPIADNSTAAGRAANRRVVATVSNTVKKPVTK